MVERGIHHMPHELAQCKGEPEAAQDLALVLDKTHLHASTFMKVSYLDVVRAVASVLSQNTRRHNGVVSIVLGFQCILIAVWI